MQIPIECPCGKVYQKPEHKIGTRFRCHLCNRELEVTKDATIPSDAISAGDVKPKPKPPRSLFADDVDVSKPPPRASAGRTIGAWTLIFVGLAFVVAGFGQLYIYSIVDQARKSHAKAQEQMFGDQPRSRQPQDAGFVYGSAAVGITIGVLLGYVGVRIRKP